MSDELTAVDPSEVTFIEKMKESRYSVVFHVRVRGKECVMKVYHARAQSDAASSDYETDLFVRESTAYRRLKAKGLSKPGGVIPEFYGTIERIQPICVWPWLESYFADDTQPPNAVLIEYIPNMQQFDLTTFSQKRISTLCQILDDIHRAGVLHGDPMPRNMMVVPAADGNEHPERVLWIDFDSALTFFSEEEEGSLTTRQESWIKEEEEIMEYFAKAMAQDYDEGKLTRAYSYYYQWYR